MPLPVIPVPAFPSIPQAAGVPSMPRQFGQTQNTVVAAVADVNNVLNFFLPPQWGLFLAGSSSSGGIGSLSIGGLITGALSAGSGGSFNSIINGANGAIIADAVVSVDYKTEARVSIAPQEFGAFDSYNKVQTPDEARVTFSKGGLDSDKTAFLQQLTQAKQSVALFNLLTPNQTISNVTVVRVDYSRSQRSGAGLLLVDVWLEQINIVGAPQFSNIASPSGADPVNGGTVQTQTPPASQTGPGGLQGHA